MPEELDNYAQSMSFVMQGLALTVNKVNELQAQQNALAAKHTELVAQQRAIAQAAYHGATSSGKSRLVSELVKIESDKSPRGAQQRVADLLAVSAARVSQLVNSPKNRKNGR